MKRFLSSPFFLLAGLCFFLPFVTISCSSLEFAEGFAEGFGEAALEPQERTGIDIVLGETTEEAAAEATPTPTGTAIPGLGDLGQVGTEEAADNSQLYAIIALAAAALGIFLSLLPGAAGPIVAIILGLGGGVSLFLVKNEIDGTIPSQAETFIDVKYEIGFWLALGLFVVAALTGLIRMLMRDRPALGPPATAPGFGLPEAPPPTMPPPGPPPAAPPPSTTPPG